MLASDQFVIYEGSGKVRGTPDEDSLTFKYLAGWFGDVKPNACCWMIPRTTWWE